MLSTNLNSDELLHFFDQLWKQSLNPFWACKVVGDDFEIVAANPAAMRIDRRQSPGARVREIAASIEGKGDLLSGYYKCVRTGEAVEYEQRLTLRGKEYLFRTLVVPIKNDEGVVTHIWGTSHNLTDFLDPQKELLQINKILNEKVQERTQQLEDAIQEMERLTITDDLTGLSNRRHFNDALERAIKTSRSTGNPVGLIFIDIDYFKRYNDTYGHAAGDECLKMVAQAISSFKRRNTDIVARYGGEEFVILMFGVPEKRLLQVLDYIQSAVVGLKIPHRSSSVQVKGESIVTISAGLALAAGPELTGDKLLKLADDALYEVKKSGRNNYKLVNLLSEKNNATNH